MYVQKTKSGKFNCVMYIKTPTDKKKRISVVIEKDTKKNRELAFETLTRKKEEFYQNFEENTKVYFHNFLDNEYTDFVKKKKFNTMIANLMYVKKLKEYSLNIEISKINYKFCYNLIKKMSTKYSYNNVLKHVKKSINYAYQLGYIKDVSFLNRFKKELTKKEKEFFYLEKEQLIEILDFYKNMDEDFSLLIEFLILTGLRIGEALALTFNDNYEEYLDINKTMIHNTDKINSPKTASSTRKIIKNNRITEILNIQKLKLDKMRLQDYNFNQKNLVFFNTKGTCFYYNALQKKLSLYKKIHLNFHLFRHTHASLLIEKGVSVDAVARRLGHSDNKITQEIYIHMTKKLQEKENEIFKTVKII